MLLVNCYCKIYYTPPTHIGVIDLISNDLTTVISLYQSLPKFKSGFDDNVDYCLNDIIKLKKTFDCYSVDNTIPLDADTKFIFKQAGVFGKPKASLSKFASILKPKPASKEKPVTKSTNELTLF